MNDCCNQSELQNWAKKLACPVSGVSCVEVAAKTILHHVKEPWSIVLKNQGYYFCGDKSCDVAYFGEDGSTISKQSLRQQIGIKESSEEAFICYCFGVSREVAFSSAAVRDFVVRKTKEGSCSCATHNPSGRCCLKDFPKHIES